MKKEQDKSQQQQVKEIGTKFLNDYLAFILGRTDDANAREFLEAIKKVADTNKVYEIFDEYKYIGFLIGCFYDISNNRVDIFEKKSLQLNSIISTSLNIEQHINDLTYNKDLLLKQKLVGTSNVAQHPELTEITHLRGVLEKIASVKERLTNKLGIIPVEELADIENIYNDIETMVNVLEEQNKKTANQIADAKKNEYFILNLNKDKTFIAFLESVYKQFIINELVINIAKDFYKEYGIKATNQYEALKGKQNKCLTISSYPFITHRVAKLLELSLLNNNVPNITTALSKYISLEEETATAEYKKVLEKYVKKADKELAKATTIEDLTNEVDSYLDNLAKKMLAELRWCEID